MSFREKMMTGYPNAEIELDIELQKRRLLRLCHSKGSTIVFHGNGKYTIVPKERLTRQIIADCEGFTIPDRTIQKEGKVYPIYLDGVVHLKAGSMKRDARIDGMLESCGLTAHRFAYKGKLSKERLNEIVNEIEEMIK